MRLQKRREQLQQQLNMLETVEQFAQQEPELMKQFAKDLLSESNGVKKATKTPTPPQRNGKIGRTSSILNFLRNHPNSSRQEIVGAIDPSADRKEKSRYNATIQGLRSRGKIVSIKDEDRTVYALA